MREEKEKSHRGTDSQDEGGKKQNWGWAGRKPALPG